MGERNQLGTGARNLLSTITVLGALLFSCAEAKEPIFVIFPGPLDIEPGAAVAYQGVDVGSVRGVFIQQPSPEKPGEVVIALVIESPGVTLRESDEFSIASRGLLGDSYLSISAGGEPSPPLAPRAEVRGTPPLTTRFIESFTSAVDSFSELSREKKESFLQLVAETFDSDESP